MAYRSPVKPHVMEAARITGEVRKTILQGVSSVGDVLPRANLQTPGPAQLGRRTGKGPKKSGPRELSEFRRKNVATTIKRTKGFGVSSFE